jgi:imidazolonepropionase-like amidohydrolase
VQPSKENLEKFGPVLKNAVDAGVCVLLSPDECVFNVPGFSMYEEMKLYKAAGLTNYQILKCATLNAATCLKEQKSWGSIEIGKKANFVLLNSNPLENIDNIKDVEATIIHGRYYTQKELLEQLKANK